MRFHVCMILLNQYSMLQTYTTHKCVMRQFPILNRETISLRLILCHQAQFQLNLYISNINSKHKLESYGILCEIIFQNKINYRYEVYVYSNSYNKHTCEMSYAVLDLLENFAFLCVCNSTCSNTFLGCWVFSKYIFPKFSTETSKNEKIHTNKFSRQHLYNRTMST